MNLTHFQIHIMKKIAAVLLILFFSLALTGCESRTNYGECVGFGSDKDPTLLYSVSGRNMAMAVIFSETLIVPIVTLTSEAMCPYSKNPNKQ